MYPPSPLQNSRNFIEIRVNASLAIPMPVSHIQRTESEIRLHEDTAVAEYRDQCMFDRLVRGIRHRQQQCYGLESSHNGCASSRDRLPMVLATSESIDEAERSIENIVSTRNRFVHFSQDTRKIVPTGSGKLQRLQKSDAYYIDESIHIPRRPAQDFEDWTIKDFDDTVPISNMIQDFNMIQTEAIPDMYESDEFSCYDDEVFDIDL